MAKTTLFVNIETEDLIQIFDNPKVKQNVEEIFERVLDKKLNKNISSEQEVLGVVDTLSFLGIKRATLYKWTSEGIIPHCKPEGKLFFIRKDLIEWIKSGKVRTRWELDEEAEKFINSRTRK